jgi:cytochrome c-type biogenesis protein CcmH/NrfF
MKRHAFDPWSLIGGVFLAAIGGIFLIPAQPLNFSNQFTEVLAWAGPVVIVLVGVALIVPALKRRQPPPEPPTDIDPVF